MRRKMLYIWSFENFYISDRLFLLNFADIVHSVLGKYKCIWIQFLLKFQEYYVLSKNNISGKSEGKMIQSS